MRLAVRQGGNIDVTDLAGIIDRQMIITDVFSKIPETAFTVHDEEGIELGRVSWSEFMNGVEGAAKSDDPEDTKKVIKAWYKEFDKYMSDKGNRELFEAKSKESKNDKTTASSMFMMWAAAFKY